MFISGISQLAQLKKLIVVDIVILSPAIPSVAGLFSTQIDLIGGGGGDNAT